MKLETFFEKFDLFIDAPDAVGKMRELVLELSATGRLIPEALERPVDKDTKLMGTIVELVMGQAPAGHECNTEGKGTIFVKVGEFGRLYPEKTVWTTNPLKFAKAGDVLVCVVGATVGKLNLAIDCAIGRSVAAIRPSSALETKFLYYSLIPYTLRLRRNSRGSAQGVIGKGELNAVSLWVPSIAVQKRIVAKVDELMALCDRLEAQQQERTTRHAALARASLARFADAPTPANLHLLFHKSYDIAPADLRKSILFLAVQGKLVPQDPNDEPARALVERVSALRVKFSPGKRSKAAKKIRELDDAKCSHDVPDSWTWCRLGDIVLDFRYGTSRKCARNVSGVPVLRIPNIQNGRIDSTDLKFTDMPPAEFEELRLQDGDLLLVRSNGSENLVGRSAVAVVEDERFAYAGYLVRARLPKKEVFAPFLHVALSTPSVRDQIEGPIRTTSGVKNINTTELSNLVFPLPPLAEQRRIVAKVDELLSLVDALETQLATAITTAKTLLEAIVVELTRQHQPARM